MNTLQNDCVRLSGVSTIYTMMKSVVRNIIEKDETQFVTGEALTTNDVAKELEVAPATVRLYERVGKLTATRTRGGIRLFRAEDVQRLACERAARRAEK